MGEKGWITRLAGTKTRRDEDNKCNKIHRQSCQPNYVDLTSAPTVRIQRAVPAENCAQFTLQEEHADLVFRSAICVDFPDHHVNDEVRKDEQRYSSDEADDRHDCAYLHEHLTRGVGLGRLSTSKLYRCLSG